MELLAPAGNFEKAKTAFLYGADAVYCGLNSLSLRTAADHLTQEELQELTTLAHADGKKVYITANAIPHNHELKQFDELCQQAVGAKADALIISDLGALSIASDYAKEIDLHISTQASNTNYRSMEVWHRLGAKRIVMARELSLKEIAEIRTQIPKELELEMFVHGAMCISYSGRCLLSNYLTHRDANRGACAQPCRWKYYLTEETRPGEQMEITENENGTFLFNSKDLCLISYLDDIYQAGVNSLKIEGRMKSSYYVATVTKAYRQALDDWAVHGADYAKDPYYYEEVCKVSHRDYYTGFAFSKPDENGQIYGNSSYIRECDMIGVVQSVDEQKQTAVIEQRNRFFAGDEIEVVPPQGRFFTMRMDWMRDENGQSIEVAPHAQMKVVIPMEQTVPPGTILRKKVE